MGVHDVFQCPWMKLVMRLASLPPGAALRNEPQLLEKGVDGQREKRSDRSWLHDEWRRGFPSLSYPMI